MGSLWKIKHKSTGLFYHPVKGYPKKNLSKNGKVYNQKPTLEHLRHGYNMIVDGESIFVSPNKFVDSEFERIKSHFEIIEMPVLESKSSDE